MPSFNARRFLKLFLHLANGILNTTNLRSPPVCFGFVIMASDSFSTASSASEFNAFCEFIVQIRNHGNESLTPEQSVAEFRNYQNQVRQWQEKNQLSQQQLERGEAVPLDDQAILGRLRQRFDQEEKSELDD